MPNRKGKQTLSTIRGLKTLFPIKSGLLGRAKSYVQAVNDINLTIYRGEILGLVGESGCGKATLGKTILQLYKPMADETMYEFEDGSRNLAKLKKNEVGMVRRKIRIVSRDPQSSLNPSFTIYQSLSDPLKKFGAKTEAERGRVIRGLLEAINMCREYMDHYPHEFSGGQGQCIGITRALYINPKLVICNETASALDVSTQAQILQFLKGLKEKHNLTYIFIIHDLSMVGYMSDRIAAMCLGRIVELTDVDELCQHNIHPYTQVLLSAIPIADISHKKERTVLKSDVSPSVNPPSGYHFHERCRMCQEVCKKEKLGLQRYITEGREHFVACHFAKENMEACAVPAESMQVYQQLGLVWLIR